MADQSHLGALQRGYDTAVATRQALKDKQAKRESLKTAEELKLAKAGYMRQNGQIVPRQNSTPQVQEEQNKMMLKKLNTMSRGLILSKTKQATADAMQTGDMSHLQNILQDPEVADTFRKRNIHQFGNIDFENDQKLLKAYGIPDSTKLSPDQREVLKKKFFKAYDGKEWKAFPLDVFAAHTGFAKNANAAQMQTFAEYNNLGKGGKSAESAAKVKKIDAQAETAKANTDLKKKQALKVAEETKIKAQKAKSQADLGKEKLKETVRHNKAKEAAKTSAASKDKSESGEFKAGHDEFGKMSAVASDLKRSEKAMDDFVSKYFGGDKEQFYNTNLRLPKNAAKFAASKDAINKVRALARVNVTGADKKRLDELTKLTSLASSASDLGGTDVGWWDSTVKQAASYFTNNPKFLGNVEAKSSFEAYKGILRVAMIGAAQTTSEMRNFTKMLGNQTQQHYTLLTQLDSSLGKMQAQYEAFSATVGHRAVAKMLTGGDLITLKKSRAKIAKALARYETKSPIKKRRASKYFKGKAPTKSVTSSNKRNPGESIKDFLSRTGGK